MISTTHSNAETATALSPPSSEPAFAPVASTQPVSGPAAWQVVLRSGQTLCTPPSTQSLTTYVLLEQEGWFEPEMSLLPLLLEPGMHALDIGANHGVYTLEMARCTGNGRVIAFEPTAEPRARLQQSVAINGLHPRVDVVPAGLSDADGSASFAVNGNSELNSRSGTGSARETVRLLTLDGYLAAHEPGLVVGFVKLDAEGDEARVIAGAQAFFATQSPVVLFEFQHGSQVNTELIGCWQSLGFDIFRWSAELELLLPFDAAKDELAHALNLLAIRPQQQAVLLRRGLLVDRASSAPNAAESLAPATRSGQAEPSLQAWCALPAMQGLAPESADDVASGGSALYASCLQAVTAAHLGTALSPAERLASMTAARDRLQAAADNGASLGPAAWGLLVHVLFALGAVHASQRLALELLARWPQGSSIDVPFVPPRLSDMARMRSTAAAPWLRQMLGEHIELRSAHSSYFRPPNPQRLATLLQHPDHSVEIERRYLLARMRCDDRSPMAPLRWLTDGRRTRNAPMWHGLLASMNQARLD